MTLTIIDEETGKVTNASINDILVPLLTVGNAFILKDKVYLIVDTLLINLDITSIAVVTNTKNKT